MLFLLARKLFQLRPHCDEEFFPSVNFGFEYSNRMRFLHRIQLPFRALTYELALEFLLPDAILPFEVSLLLRDELQTETPQIPIARAEIHRDHETGTITAEFHTESDALLDLVRAIQSKLVEVPNEVCLLIRFLSS